MSDFIEAFLCKDEPEVEVRQDVTDEKSPTKKSPRIPVDSMGFLCFEDGLVNAAEVRYVWWEGDGLVHIRFKDGETLEMTALEE